MVMKKKISCISFAAIIITFLAWMTFSSRWVAVWRNENDPIIQETLDSEFMGLSFLRDIQFSQIDTIYDTILFMGISYNISDATEEETTRSVVLNSADRSYKIPFDGIYRNTYVMYDDFDQTPKLNTGIGFEFCPLGIKDGLYKVILQVEENGIPAMRVSTGYVIEKTHGRVALRYRPSEQVDESITTVKEWANVVFSKFELLNDGTLNLAGWGVIAGNYVTEDKEVYLEVFNGAEKVGTFNATKESITTPAHYYNQPGYYAAGFQASIPGVSKENLKIIPYVKYEGDFYRCKYHYEPDETMKNLGYVMDIE